MPKAGAATLAVITTFCIRPPSGELQPANAVCASLSVDAEFASQSPSVSCSRGILLVTRQVFVRKFEANARVCPAPRFFDRGD